MNTNYIFEEYKEGTTFTIIAKPSAWASRLNKNNPFNDCDLVYPYTAKIVQVVLDGDYYAMTDGVYGWSLSTLIEENKIYKPLELRRKKLKNLLKLNK